MLVFPCFPAIARRGFAKLSRAQLGKTSGVLQRIAFVNTCYFSAKRNRAVQKSGAFAKEKQFRAGVAKVQKAGVDFRGSRFGHWVKRHSHETNIFSG